MKTRIALCVAALAPLFAAAHHQDFSPQVRVHRIDPVLAVGKGEAAPAEGPVQTWAIPAQEDGGGRGGSSKIEDLTRLTVRGHAELEKAADRLRLGLGVVTQMASAAEALAENNRIMNEVVKAVGQVGLEAGEFETGNFDLQPVYSQRPIRLEGEWEPKIIGYRASNIVEVKSKKLDLAGKLIQAAGEAGANQIGGIGFDLADPRVHRAEAIRVATANALTDAQTLAAAAGVTLVRIVSVDLDPFAYQPVPFPKMEMRTAAADVGVPPITPGDVTVTAGVTMVYEIK